jgi:hypothetical protein
VQCRRWLQARWDEVHDTCFKRRLCGGGEMLKEKHKNYVLLAQGYIDHGRLTLFPIEVYDFIDPPEMFLLFLHCR